MAGWGGRHSGVGERVRVEGAGREGRGSKEGGWREQGGWWREQGGRVEGKWREAEGDRTGLERE